MVSGATHSSRSNGFIEMSTASPVCASPACGSPFLKTRASYSTEEARSGSRKESPAPVGAPPEAS